MRFSPSGGQAGPPGRGLAPNAAGRSGLGEWSFWAWRAGDTLQNVPLKSMNELLTHCMTGLLKVRAVEVQSAVAIFLGGGRSQVRFRFEPFFGFKPSLFAQLLPEGAHCPKKDCTFKGCILNPR